mmetsp:Transcript_7370/g.29932  ORF Transcript_7370/g.29932 Transcript_7370/m.29932 type:complete len:384 (-) Transcript_7370:47-1198(-)
MHAMCAPRRAPASSAAQRVGAHPLRHNRRLRLRGLLSRRGHLHFEPSLLQRDHHVVPLVVHLSRVNVLRERLLVLIGIVQGKVDLVAVDLSHVHLYLLTRRHLFGPIAWVGAPAHTPVGQQVCAPQRTSMFCTRSEPAGASLQLACSRNPRGRALALTVSLNLGTVQQGVGPLGDGDERAEVRQVAHGACELVAHAHLELCALLTAAALKVHAPLRRGNLPALALVTIVTARVAAGVGALRPHRQAHALGIQVNAQHAYAHLLTHLHLLADVLNERVSDLRDVDEAVGVRPEGDESAILAHRCHLAVVLGAHRDVLQLHGHLHAAVAAACALPRRAGGCGIGVRIGARGHAAACDARRASAACSTGRGGPDKGRLRACRHRCV